MNPSYHAVLDQHSNNIVADFSSSRAVSVDRHVPKKKSVGDSVGKPAKKKCVHTLDILAVVVSSLCLALGILSVASERVSWMLGVENDQLIVLGLLLSIMNLCLGRVIQYLFLLLEVRFGRSTLQNYDGLIRNQPLGSDLSLMWRFILVLMISLPIGLSAAYKSFTGGESAIEVDPTIYTGNSSYYGIFAPPGNLYYPGATIGVSLFANATSPFAQASSLEAGREPPLPSKQQAYGFNILLIDNETSAFLDIPQPQYITAVQQTLALGESWNVSAPVNAIVATFNQTKKTDRAGFDQYLTENWNAAIDSSGAFAYLSSGNDKAIQYLVKVGDDMSQQYLGFTPNFGSLLNVDQGLEGMSARNFSEYADLFTLNRQACHGTWSITRGSIRLVDGVCSGDVLGDRMQRIVTSATPTYSLTYYYMQSLLEFLGMFASGQSESEWKAPYMATGMAGVLWSRLTTADSPANSNAAKRLYDGSFRTDQELGLIYQVNDKALYIRPTLKKSPWLYFVLAVQPVLTLLALASAIALHSTPIDRGFGIVSILAGVNHESLDVLDGATLSGEVSEDVRMSMVPARYGEKYMIRYDVGLLSLPRQRRKSLAPRTVYH